MKLSFRYYKTKKLIVTILALAVGFDVGFEFIQSYLHQSGEFILRAPTNTAIIASLLVVYDKYLWKYPVFNSLVKVPNLNGRYTGYIEYERDGQKNKMDTVVEIIQTASEIQINTYFNSENHENTHSISLVENIRSENGHYSVYFFYFNSGTKIDEYLDCHEGANELKVIMNGNTPRKLTGNYFTNRKEQTRGKMKVNFTSTELKHEF
ncbi:hypothetical protein SAMN05443144_13212 [Fodinibius roseus]|uniref:CD-NTase-associated protein 15 domain-containing protein n=1 Tax=Fodinibius roseus TaxID=1194090 RepID=A0A1M5KI07_9BACT|nr:hypothetical protein [Fodinibius roseus]SHG52119.1 hypothetical protein SAMN05443144_13212 [Fodinibius roseus]